ncbi:unnamed protein product [Rotaria socialis]|uniref:Protein kinase domain-containing protein n=2 Tax=Rotaria socialis TaxID=392032 RepID=A0A818D0M7_9BILA|nr:unnamed protein product [Rotaria socialis]CAF4181250.1 unnamed protein product [Rotaria socialis]
MCEETTNYLWAVQDILGHGATSSVYKAYNKSTGELVAAKVYQVSSSARTPGGEKENRNRDYRPILDHELDILKSTDHPNIVRYIALEPVVPLEPSRAPADREALFIEYCNGGSLNNVLELPENRYGLMEDEFMLVFKQITNALKYLHTKNTIHRDIKPDNIMLSININGERTYKLADLGVARLINEGENAFTTLVGTEEYIHPDLYRAAVHDNKTNALRTALQTRVDFPFEVDLWSLGVTLYQCATGELPFQPFAGTRKDRAVMKRILDTKPAGCISGVENSPGGDIKWSNSLPESCRLSKDLKKELENLLRRVMESDRNKLMRFREFFTETDRIFNLMRIYYLNLKRFTLTCSYFVPTQSITELFDQLRRQNRDNNDEEYFCLFQNMPYPISKTKPMSIKTFCEQLPIPTSRETPLVFYTFSPIDIKDSYCPTVFIPDVKSIRQYNDVAAAYDWSNDMVGNFFYLKTQLIEYQNILKTAQCSTTIMQQQLKSNLLEFLCSIRSKLIVFRAIEELKYILDQMDINANSQPPASNNVSMSSNNGSTASVKIIQPANGEAPSIGFSHLYNNSTSSESNSLSPASPRRTSTASPMQLIQQSIRIYLRSYHQPYEQIKKCEQDILEIIEKQFNGKLGMIDDQQPFDNTLWSPHCTKPYSAWVQRADKFLKDLNDLNDSFRKDRLLSTYNRLQSDSHFRRRKNLEQLHDQYVHFINEECTPNLAQVYNDYNDWILLRSNLIKDYRSIGIFYDKQCDDIIHYVDLLEDVRTVVYKNIRELGGTASPMAIPNDLLQAPLLGVRMNLSQSREDGSTHQQPMVIGDEDNNDESSKKFMDKVLGTTKKTIHHAEEGFLRLDTAIRQIRTNIHKK